MLFLAISGIVWPRNFSMHRIKQLTLAAGDMLMLCIGLFFALALRTLTWPTTTFTAQLSSVWFVFPIALLLLFIIGLYDVGRARNSFDFYQKIIISAGFWLVISAVVFYVAEPNGVTPKTILLIATVTGFGLIALWRFLYNRFLSTTLGTVSVVLAGASPEATKLLQELIHIFAKEPERGYVIKGIVVPAAMEPYETSVPWARSLAELVQKTGGRYPALVVVDPMYASDQHFLNELYDALSEQVSVIEVVDFYESIFHRIPPSTFSETWFITHLREQQNRMYDRFRILIDYCAAVCLFVLFALTYPLVALLIKLTSSGPVLFSQERVGRGGKVFVIHKYRTMRALTSSGSAELAGAQYASENDPRITPFGKFLRQTRIDELPQCINMLRGEMGLVGPRPERPEFVATLTSQMPFYPLRHLVKPGLTGWAQLQHSYYGTIEENLFKLQYDLFYIKNRGLLLDVNIILRTVFVVLRMIGR